MEQELLYPSEAHEFTPVLVGFMLLKVQFSVQCFVDHCLSSCPFSFDHCIVCPTIYNFYYPLSILVLKRSFNRWVHSQKLCASARPTRFCLWHRIAILFHPNCSPRSAYTYKQQFLSSLLVWFGLVLNATSTIFQLYRGGQFYWWRKSEYPEKPPTCHKSLTNFIT